MTNSWTLNLGRQYLIPRQRRLELQNHNKLRLHALTSVVQGLFLTSGTAVWETSGGKYWSKKKNLYISERNLKFSHRILRYDGNLSVFGLNWSNAGWAADIQQLSISKLPKSCPHIWGSLSESLLQLPKIQIPRIFDIYDLQPCSVRHMLKEKKSCRFDPVSDLRRAQTEELDEPIFNGIWCWCYWVTWHLQLVLVCCTYSLPQVDQDSGLATLICLGDKLLFVSILRIKIRKCLNLMLRMQYLLTLLEVSHVSIW